MRAAKWTLVSVLAFQGLAEGAVVRPPEVLVTVDVGAPLGERSAWQTAIAKLVPTVVLPPVDQLSEKLGQLVGIKRIDGIDFSLPLHVLFLNPERFPQPLVLILPVARQKQKTFAASFKDAPLQQRVQKGYAVVGSEAAVKLVESYAFSNAKAKTQGVHVVAFVQSVWTAFGDKLRAGKALLLAAATAQKSQAVAPDTLGRLFDGVLDGIEQSDEFAVDLGTQKGAFDLELSLKAKAGTAIDEFVALQKPSDFALAELVKSEGASLFGAGNLNLTSVKSTMLNWMLGPPTKEDKTKDAALRAAVEELYQNWTGGLAMAGKIASLSKMEYQYLMETRDPKRAVTLLPRTFEMMSKMGGLVGGFKMTKKDKPAFDCAGLKVAQEEITLDFSAVPNYQGPKTIQQTYAFAAFDKLVGSVHALDPKAIMCQLADGVRDAQKRAPVSESVRKSLQKARDAKESFWVKVDLARLMTEEKSLSMVPMSAAWNPTITIGFLPRVIRMRATLGE